MDIFSGNSKGVVAWGPTASVTVRVDALEGIVNDRWILTNFSIGAKEIVDVRQCFNDVSYIYALGNDQSSCAITLTFAIFIGQKSCTGESNTSAIEIGMKRYVNNRISQKTSSSSITIGLFSAKGWLTSVDIGQMDPARAVCYGTVHFIMELPKT